MRDFTMADYEPKRSRLADEYEPDIDYYADLDDADIYGDDDADCKAMAD